MPRLRNIDKLSKQSLKSSSIYKKENKVSHLSTPQTGKVKSKARVIGSGSIKRKSRPAPLKLGATSFRTSLQSKQLSKARAARSTEGDEGISSTVKDNHLRTQPPSVEPESHPHQNQLQTPPYSPIKENFTEITSSESSELQPKTPPPNTYLQKWLLEYRLHQDGSPGSTWSSTSENRPSSAGISSSGTPAMLSPTILPPPTPSPRSKFFAEASTGDAIPRFLITPTPSSSRTERHTPYSLKDEGYREKRMLTRTSNPSGLNYSQFPMPDHYQERELANTNSHHINPSPERHLSHCFRLHARRNRGVGARHSQTKSRYTTEHMTIHDISGVSNSDPPSQEVPMEVDDLPINMEEVCIFPGTFSSSATSFPVISHVYGSLPQADSTLQTISQGYN